MSARWSQIRTTAAICLMISWGAFGLWGQTNVARLAGTVTDVTGASVPTAKVSAINNGTGLEHVTETDAAGLYAFPALVAGTYTLTAEKEGFRRAERTDLRLIAASSAQVDLRLELGAVTESVSVSANMEQIQAASGEVSRVITGTQATELALNGRNYSQVLWLLPGVAAKTTDAFGIGLSTTRQAVNGIRSNSANFTVDGTDNLDAGSNSNAIINPSVDTIAEVRVLTASYSAEFGRFAGPQVNVVVKSGTREFHGTLFEFVRNDAFSARSFFAQGLDPLRYNNFGWTLGGPVLLPNHWNSSREKLFFFAAQEWKYNHQGRTTVNNVPTAAERAGDFGSSSLSAPVDPTTGTPFPNRTVPASRFSRNGPLLLSPLPLPNSTGGGGNYVFTGVNRTDTRQDLVKADYIVSPMTQLSARWTRDTWGIWNALQGTSLGFVPGGRSRPGYVAFASVSHTFSPTLYSNFSFNISGNQIAGTPQNDGLRRDKLGTTIPYVFPQDVASKIGGGIVPNFSMAGFTAYNRGDLMINMQTTFQWRYDLSKVVGPHTLKFGVLITRTRKNQNLSVADNGAVVFNTSAQGSTKNVVADVLLGNFQSYTEYQQDAWWWARYTQPEFYGQDSWRVSRRLTLEMGVRYSIPGVPYSALGNYSSFLPSRFDPSQAPVVSAQDGSLAPGTGNPLNGIVILGSDFPAAAMGRVPAASDSSLKSLFAGLPKGGYATEYGAIAPRLGFAYDPFGDGNTSVRGGLGVFFDQVSSGFQYKMAGLPPFVSSQSIYNGNIDSPAGGTARAFPPALVGMPLDLKNPQVYSFNLGVQRQLPGSAVLDVAYVGSLGRHLFRGLNLNQLLPGTLTSPAAKGVNVQALRPYRGYGNIVIADHGDNSNYNSLQMALNRRLSSSGLSFGVSYTFSKTLDSTSGGTLVGDGPSPQNSYDARPDYGLSAIHRKHILNFNYIYELPFFRKAANPVARNVLGGWQISGITSSQSGAPTTVTVPSDIAGIGVSSARASLTGDPKLPSGERTVARWFNPKAFMLPSAMTPGQFGNAGRNILIGPGFVNCDVSLSKRFVVRERLQVQFRADSFNIFNHPSFTSINTSVRFDSAGNPTSGFGGATGAVPGRALEFGLRLQF